MRPYFDTNHVAGLLISIVILAWGAMEFAEASQGLATRKGAVTTGRRSLWAATLVCAIAAMNVVLYLAPRIVPQATIRPGAVAFAVGLVILIAGLVLRGWSFKALGQYFTFIVMVSSDQQVVAHGPYRLVRHPSYTGILLASAGLGLASANWAGLAGVLVVPLTLILWRIHVEENALLATLGDGYRSYAAQRKRLVPLVW